MGSVRFGVKITGQKKLLNQLKKAQRLIPQEFAKYMYEELLEIMDESQRQVPVDTGALKRSGYVDRPKLTRTRIQTRIGYAGRATKINPRTGQPTSKYASTVHEVPRNYRIGKYKYLEDPIKERQPYIAKNIARKIKRRLRNGV